MASLNHIIRTALIGAAFVAGFSGAAQAQDQAPETLKGPQRVITIKCEELDGHTASYGSLKDFFTGKDRLQPGVVDWPKKGYYGAAPTIVLTNHARGAVLIDIEIRQSTYEKRGVNKAELLKMMGDKTMYGTRVNGNVQEDSLFVQFMRSIGDNRGVELFSVDSETKSLMMNRAYHHGDGEGKRRVGGALFISKCEWFENQIALD
jgi:hypothetical protein